MCRKSLTQIFCKANIDLSRKIDAFEEINVSHQMNSADLLRKSAFAKASADTRHAKVLPAEALAKAGGGARRDRTADLLHAMQALSQLSYGPIPDVRYQESGIK